MTLTVEEVLALAPDDASAKAARGLVAPGRWPRVGATPAAVWGECQGSGAKPYQTQVDLSGPAFKCSCPSRKFPCKHGLALLLMRAQDAQRFGDAEAPAWVADWLASRSEKAEKKDARQAEKEAAPSDPLAVARREAQRWQRIEGAAHDLQRFLADQLARGLGSLDAGSLAAWSTMAARMVDAQAPGLGARLTDALALVRQGDHWPERVLHALGLLQLGCDALARRTGLPPARQADLRTLAGWPHDQAEVTASGERLADRWLVLGVATEERANKLTERRVWLRGERSGRSAWLLDHAFAGRGFKQPWLTGSAVSAELAFFPATSRLRALVVEQSDARGSGDVGSWLQQGVGVPSDDGAWQAVAERVAASPWVTLHPVLLRHVAVAQHDGQAMVHQGDLAWPLRTSDADLWRLLACTGGAPVTLAAEWDGAAVCPLTAWQAPVAPVWSRAAG